MVGRLVQKEDIRFLQKQANQAQPGLLPSGKPGQFFPLTVLGESQGGKEPVILLLIFKPLPGKFLTRRTGGQHLLLQCPLQVGKHLLAEASHHQLPVPADSRTLALVVPVQSQFPRSQPQESGLARAVFPHQGNFLIAPDFKIDMPQNGVAALRKGAVDNLIQHGFSLTRFPADRALPGTHSNSASWYTGCLPYSATSMAARKMGRCSHNN